MARVLIVDDEFLIARYTQIALEGLGHEVVGLAMHAEDAIEMARVTRPDLLVIDIVLPDSRDGFGVLAAVRGFLDIPAIFLSGNLDRLALQRVAECGRALSLHKPCDEADLDRAVKSILS